MLSMLLIASIMMFPKVSVAGDVDSKKARQVGAYFMASQFGSKAITDNSLKQVYEIPNMERNIPALYVFNTADDCSTKLRPEGVPHTVLLLLLSLRLLKTKTKQPSLHAHTTNIAQNKHHHKHSQQRCASRRRRIRQAPY